MEVPPRELTDSRLTCLGQPPRTPRCVDYQRQQAVSATACSNDQTISGVMPVGLNSAERPCWPVNRRGHIGSVLVCFTSNAWATNCDANLVITHKTHKRTAFK